VPAAAEDRSTQRIAAWLDALEVIEGDLQRLAGRSEQDFLELGSRLNEFAMRASEVAILASRAVGRIQTGDAQESIETLRGIFDRIEGYLSQVCQETALTLADLESVVGNLDSSAEPLADFRKIQKTLRALGTSTKIESARLGDKASGFTTLAVDVEQLAQQINEKSAIIGGQREDVCGRIRGMNSTISRLGGELQTNVSRVMETTRLCLASLAEMNGRFAAVAETVSLASAEVSRRIGDLVSALQIHDITRQRIEHVVEAVQELVAALRAGNQDRHDPARQSGRICGLARLQEAQLDHARQEFASAIATVAASLEEIAARETELLDETRQAAGMDGGREHSVIAEMEEGLSQVVSLLDQSLAQDRHMTEVVVDVGRTVESIYAFVGEIETVGEEIELISINAQVQAIRTGDEGAALGVLAEAIQKLSVDASRQTGVVAGILTDVGESCRTLISRVERDGSELAAEFRGVTSEMQGLITGLDGVNQELHRSLAAMGEEVDGIARGIEQSMTLVEVHDGTLAVMAGAVGSFGEIARQARELAPPGDEGERFLAALADRYTMESEREVHNRMSGAETGIAVGQSFAAPAGGGDDGLGDNVELF
jgi:methyl-accepting chemotaxis protein